MKKILLILCFSLLFTSELFSQNFNYSGNNELTVEEALGSGYLNVITGNEDAQIYVDGAYAGNDFIRQYKLVEGEHYVRVELDGKLMYAKMVTIYPDRLQTITSENFVDIRTDTANRGAIERESRRLNETKGNLGIGFIWGDNYPAKGMSIKYFTPLNIGLQFSAIGNVEVDDSTVSEIGLRGIFLIGNKIFSDNNLTGYTTFGIIQSTVDADKTTYLGGSAGIEFAFGDPLYFNLEFGISNPISDDSDAGLEMTWSGGLHFFF